MRLWRMIVVVCSGVSLASGGVGDWKTFTAQHEVRGLAWDETRQIVWVVTSGGMYSYRDADKTFHEFTTSEGLRTTDLSAVALDSGGTIWVGATNGFLHRYHPATNEWEYFPDIYSKPDPQKGINRLTITGDTLVILSDIGVSMFSIPRMEFGDTYTRFGPGSNPLVGNATDFTIFAGAMWVATRSGIASTSLSNPHPSAPESWQVYGSGQGLPSTTVNRLGTAFDSLFAGTSSGLASLGSLGWSVVAGTEGVNVADLSSGRRPCIDCSSLYFITASDLRAYVPGTPPGTVANGFQSALVAMGGNRFLGTSNGLLVFGSAFTGTVVDPPGPPSDHFIGLAVDRKGVVWSGTGINGGGVGYMNFDGKQWKSFTVGQDARLGNNDYYKVSFGRDGAKWVSSWGAGVAIVDDAGHLKKVLNTSNGLLPTLPDLGSHAFVVVGGTATDGAGRTWITNRTPPSDTALVLFNADSSVSYVTGLDTRNPVLTFTDVAIDLYGTKWLANYSTVEQFVPGRGAGFYYYNEGLQIPGTSDGWGRITTSDGLTSDKVYSVAVDNNGDLWIGTDQGITIIFDPGDPKNHIALYHPARDQLIQAIVVDPLNNKWVATRQGVFLYSPDGTSILAHYTVENTAGKLLDDNVVSMAIDGGTGTMYFGTEKGLSSLGTAAVTPKTGFEGLSFTPNPFYIPATRSLTVDGLVPGSVLKILSTDGHLLREIPTPGGRVGFWDGTDGQGRLVSTGIYLVVAFSDAGSQVATGKVAVIRR